jgi:hypothetical protein
MKTYKTYTEINEGLFFNKYSKLQTNVIAALKLNLFFVSTYGSSVAALYPFFESIVKNTEIKSLSGTDIVLLTICAISILLKENKDNITKMMNVIKEKNLTEILNSFIKVLGNFSKLFSNISTQFGKVIDGLSGMFAYVALLVPFTVGMIDVINLYNINFSSFDTIMTNPKGAVISTGIGVLTLSLKSIINILIKKINRALKSKPTPSYNNSVVQSFESVNKIYENYFNI